jgi:carboxyl-terminal processing protease
MDALILDLRNNPGGLLDGAIDVSEKFLAKDKVIVSIKAKSPKQAEVFKSSGKAVHPDYPLIIIVNEGSASASEIVAGAIKDNKRGIIMGAKTYGKASVQTVIPLKDGSALRLTTALYLTPNGTLIKGEGITPDVVVEKGPVEKKKKDEAEEIFDRLEDESVNKPVKEKPAEKPAVEKDNQLESAVNLMKAIKIYRANTK